MKARLYCNTGIMAGTSFEVAEYASIGKSSGNTVVIDSPIISGKHARIFFDRKRKCYFLEDRKSRNGTTLDGISVTRKEKLSNLHIITFANKFDFIFQLINQNGKAVTQNHVDRASSEIQANNEPVLIAEAEPLQSVSSFRAGNGSEIAFSNRSKTLIEDLLKKEPRSKKNGEKGAAINNTQIDANPIHLAQKSTHHFSLEVILAENNLRSYKLKNGENAIGRSPQCEVSIDHPSMSRRHAILNVASENVTLMDLGSRNHTFVGQTAIVSEVEIKPNATLRFGTIEARLLDFSKSRSSKPLK